MEYNTLRSQLIIPEYGRHIQEMVNHCKTITDETERNGFAEIIIEVMGELNPHLRDVPDFNTNFGINFLSWLNLIWM